MKSEIHSKFIVVSIKFERIFLRREKSRICLAVLFPSIPQWLVQVVWKNDICGDVEVGACPVVVVVERSSWKPSVLFTRSLEDPRHWTRNSVNLANSFRSTIRLRYPLAQPYQGVRINLAKCKSLFVRLFSLKVRNSDNYLIFKINY